MTSASSVPSATIYELTQRRRQRQSKRQYQRLLSLWRTIFALGIVTGLTWILTSKSWQLSEPEQVLIEGNHYLSESELRQLLPLSFPQPLLPLSPNRLAQEVESIAPLTITRIERQISPPRLYMSVEDRPPVATVLDPLSQQKVGYLDAQGLLLPKTVYQSLPDNYAIPSLTVVGYTPQKREYWQTLYPLIKDSPVPILQVNWDDPRQLTLNTELGVVRLGSGGNVWLPRQLATLARLKNLPERVFGEILYIDLSDPGQPEVRVIESDAGKP
ncbi:MAG: cell division protein FtsQ [Cyanobacteria bacterium P01_H01_bin.15]